MSRVDVIFEIEEIFDIIEQGTTMPVRCRLSNGLNVIVKYMNNPYGQMVLVNEFVGSCVADILGVTIPAFGICNLSEKVISSTNMNESIDERKGEKCNGKIIKIFCTEIFSFYNCRREDKLGYYFLR